MNIINEIDDFLLARQKPKPLTSYHPSAVSDCIRKQFYKWNNIKISNPIPAGGLWKMSMGNKIHDLIAEFISEKGWEVIIEHSFRKDISLKHPLSGRIDILFWKETDLCGIEVKTAYGAGIRRMKDTGWPKQSDAKQALLYMYAMDIQEMYLIYIARDDGYRMQYLFDYRAGKLCCEGRPVKTTYENLIERYKNIEYHVQNAIVPDRPYKAAIKNSQIVSLFQKNNVKYKTDWQCSYCVFGDHCWQEFFDGETYYGGEKIC